MNHCHAGVDNADATKILQANTRPSTIARTLLSAAALLAAAASAAAADLTVSVDNIGNASGNVRAALFASAKDFPVIPERGEAVPATPGTVTVFFRNVPPGKYAVSAYHDLNDNKKLDTGMFGRPTEPVGFSRDARGRMGPPAFDDAAITIDGSEVKVAVRLR